LARPMELEHTPGCFDHPGMSVALSGFRGHRLGVDGSKAVEVLQELVLLGVAEGAGGNPDRVREDLVSNFNP
jgi:hypothetical protein